MLYFAAFNFWANGGFQNIFPPSYSYTALVCIHIWTLFRDVWKYFNAFHHLSLSQTIVSTSMHSIRLRTARLLPVFPSIHCSRGGSLPLVWRGVGVRGVPDSGAGGWVYLCSGRVYCLWSRGCASQHELGQTPPPPVNRMTDRQV